MEKSLELIGGQLGAGTGGPGSRQSVIGGDRWGWGAIGYKLGVGSGGFGFPEVEEVFEAAGAGVRLVHQMEF